MPERRLSLGIHLSENVYRCLQLIDIAVRLNGDLGVRMYAHVKCDAWGNAEGYGTRRRVSINDLP